MKKTATVAKKTTAPQAEDNSRTAAQEARDKYFLDKGFVDAILDTLTATSLDLDDLNRYSVKSLLNEVRDRLSSMHEHTATLQAAMKAGTM